MKSKQLDPEKKNKKSTTAKSEKGQKKKTALW